MVKEQLEMEKGKWYRILPVLGIAFMLLGYFFVGWQIKNLETRKNTLQTEIAQLERSKSSLTLQSKERDEIITRQNDIIKDSKDSKTQAQGEALSKALENSTVFTTLINSSKDGLKLAKEMEKRGYQALLDKNVKDAIRYFKDSENSFNGYNQVYEIAFYLNGTQKDLLSKNSDQWKKAYKKILSDFSWKMPTEFKAKLIKRLG